MRPTPILDDSTELSFSLHPQSAPCCLVMCISACTCIKPACHGYHKTVIIINVLLAWCCCCFCDACWTSVLADHLSDTCVFTSAQILLFNMFFFRVDSRCCCRADYEALVAGLCTNMYRFKWDSIMTDLLWNHIQTSGNMRIPPAKK